MDAERFDGLLRVLSTNPSRRGVGRVLAGLVLGAILGARVDLAGIEAKKGKGKGKRKKKKKLCRAGEPHRMLPWVPRFGSRDAACQ